MIKVIIERVIAEGLESHYEKAVGNLLNVMTNAPGYISGESLIDVQAPNHYVVIARWSTENAWVKWFNSENRKHVLLVIAPFLQTDEKCTLLKSLAYHKYSQHSLVVNFTDQQQQFNKIIGAKASRSFLLDLLQVASYR